MNAIFVPAIGEQFNNSWISNLEYNKNDLKFFSDKSFFKYNSALQSAYYGVPKGINYREKIKYPKENLLITDSGGFEIASCKLRGEICKIDNLQNLRWQELNADIGMNIDVPPSIVGENTYKEFKDALKQSKENFEFFEKNRKNYNMKFYNIMHGDNIQQLDEWYNEIKHFDFDGWASGMKPPNDCMLQALGAMHIWSKGEFGNSKKRGLHFFGISGKTVMPVMTYISHKLKNVVVTYDSSSYNIGSIYRTYQMQNDFNIGFGERFNLENPGLEELPCSCPVCSNININILNGNLTYSGVLISLHNLYKYVEYSKTLNSLVKNRKIFLEYLHFINLPEKTFKSIDFIDCCFDKGFDYAIDKFKDDINFKESTTQKSIFNY